MAGLMFFFFSSTRPSVLWTTASCFFMSAVTPVPGLASDLLRLGALVVAALLRRLLLPWPLALAALPAALPSEASSTFSSSNLPVAISSPS
jgi:hypothetical protein